jgi:hypothetical protein
MADGGGPPAWPALVRSILKGWPRDHTWLYWKGVVNTYVKAYVNDTFRNPTNPAKALERAEEEGAQDTWERLSGAKAMATSDGDKKPAAVPIPPDAIRANATQVAEIANCTPRTGLIKSLEGSFLSFQRKIDYRNWMVVCHDPADHVRLRALVEKQQAKPRRKPRKLKTSKRNGPK